MIDSAFPLCGERLGLDDDRVPGHADGTRECLSIEIEDELQAVPFARLGQTDDQWCAATGQRQAVLREKHLHRRSAPVETNPETMTTGGGGYVGRHTELEVDVNHSVRAARTEGLPDDVSSGAGCHARADGAERVEMLERTLRSLRNGDLALIEPRRNENAVTTARREALHLEIAVHVVQRPQHRCGREAARGVA